MEGRSTDWVPGSSQGKCYYCGQYDLLLTKILDSGKVRATPDLGEQEKTCRTQTGYKMCAKIGAVDMQGYKHCIILHPKVTMKLGNS